MLPTIDRKIPLGDEIIVELYNRYLLLLDELNNYRSKILYFMQVEDDKNPEYILELKNIKFNERISKLEQWSENQIETF